MRCQYSKVICQIFFEKMVRGPKKEPLAYFFIYLFVSRHEVHSTNTHTAERRLIQTDKTERSTWH